LCAESDRFGVAQRGKREALACETTTALPDRHRSFSKVGLCECFERWGVVRAHLRPWQVDAPQHVDERVQFVPSGDGVMDEPPIEVVLIL